MNQKSTEGDYAIPIEGLAVSRSFSVGPVTVYKSAADLPFADKVDWSESFVSNLIFDESRVQAVACVHAASPIEATSIVEQALEVLRVFQYGLMRSAHYLHFGLPGEIRTRKIFYVRHEEGGIGSGFASSGLHLGFDLVDEGIDIWERKAHAIRFAAAAIGDPNASEGAKRALMGIRYFSRSILTPEPDLRVLLIIAGLESMLSTGEKAPGRFTLARYLAYLSCWKSGPCSELNGQPCAYLILNPSNGDLDLLKRLEKLAQVNTSWVCTNWQMVNTWFDTRSGFAHGNSYDTDQDEARNFAYWAYHQYVAPVLDWLFSHQDSPAAALKTEVDALEASEIDWRSVVRTGNLEIIDTVRNSQTPPV